MAKYEIKSPNERLTAKRGKATFVNGLAVTEDEKLATAYKLTGYEVNVIEEKKPEPKKAPAKKATTTRKKAAAKKKEE
ncbi:hypothetical protein [Priestia megaterium]|uniref:hypothetical protein n=1 Tax=Priestia megaterium TaxID=1404 RepID=UPI000BF9E138|nr:hypothetical protein [Priestia megaterium]PFW43793.1 hypothetical protein COL17_26675 [Priestia megaterium]